MRVNGALASERPLNYLHFSRHMAYLIERKQDLGPLYIEAMFT